MFVLPEDADLRKKCISSLFFCNCMFQAILHCSNVKEGKKGMEKGLITGRANR
jgi:hypothetical protein